MFAFDVIEEILLRSDAKDLVPWKRVCKSWYFLISSPVFVKAHLKKKLVTSNVELRISMPSYWKIFKESLYEYNQWKVAGSSNGLVCFYRTEDVSLILLSNPWTKEVRKLPMWPLDSECKYIMGDVCLGFAYDSSIDDYKVVMEIPKHNGVSLVQVLSLKSNTWKLIGEFDYHFVPDQPGIFLHGALHWVVFKESKKIIISFNLSREEFNVIPQPNHPRYEWHFCRSRPLLGIVDDQMCLYELNRYNNLPCEIWVMRSYNVQKSWEVLPKNYDKHEVVHHMKMAEFPSPKHKRMSFFCDKNKCLSRSWRYIRAHRLVPSLLSPYAVTPSHTTNNKTSVKSWSIKAIKGEGQHSQVMLKRTIVDPGIQEERMIEELYRHEYGDTDNLYLHEDEINEIRSDVTMREEEDSGWKNGKEEFGEVVKSVIISE